MCVLDLFTRMAISTEEANRDADKAFLRACQKTKMVLRCNAQQLHKLAAGRAQGRADKRACQRLRADGRWAAMGGSMEVIEWLDQLRVDPEARRATGRLAD